MMRKTERPKQPKRNQEDSNRNLKSNVESSPEIATAKKIRNENSFVRFLKSPFRLLWKNYKGIIVILGTVIGGVPGLYTTIQWFQDKPEFDFYPEYLEKGIAFDPFYRDNVPCVIVTGAIYNGGKQPLFPSNFRLFLIADRDTVWNNSFAFSDTSDGFIESIMQNTSLRTRFAHRKDLMRVERVDPGDAKFGWLYFPLPQDLGSLKGIDKIYIECRDILNNSFRSRFNKDIVFEADGQQFMPKTGTSITQ